MADSAGMLRDLYYRVASTAYWIFFALAAAFFFPGALLIFVLTTLFDRRRVILHLYSCFWASCCLHANPMWRTKIEGRERLPWTGPAVLVANHASLIDILVLFDLFRPFKWVSKAAVFKAPFLGWNMTLNDYVPIVRGQKESVLQMMAHCKKHLANGVPVLLFPEGTRSPDGTMLPFKDGAFQLAKDVGCPLIPIAVRGTGSVLPKHGLVLREPMRARVSVLEAIDPAAYASAEALKVATRTALEAALRA